MQKGALLSLFVCFSLMAACAPRYEDVGGDGNPDGDSDRPDGQRIVAVDGGTITSEDGLFSLIIAANTFAEDVFFFIESTQEGPTFALTDSYQVWYEPNSIEAAVDSEFRVDFHLETQGLAPTEQLTLGVRRSLSGPLTQFAIIRDSTSESYVSHSPGLGYFTLLHDTRCPAEEFACGDGTCIDRALVCDTNEDCEDAADENRCQDNEDSFEPDNSFQTASEINSGDIQQRSLHVVSDSDVAIFELTTWSAIKLETSGIAGDTVLELYNQNMEQIDYNDDKEGSSFSQIVRGSLDPGTYYAEVYEYGYNSVIPNYTLSLEVEELAAPLVAPNTVTLEEELGGIWVRWSPVESADSYRIHYDVDGEPPFSSDAVALQGASPIDLNTTEMFITGLAVYGTYHFSVTTLRDDHESYYSPSQSITLNLLTDAYEADDSGGQAKLIESGDMQVHSISSINGKDYVYFELTEISDVRLEAISPRQGIVLRLTDGQGTQLERLTAENPIAGVGRRTQLNQAALTPGTYILELSLVVPDLVTPRYTLSFLAAPPLTLAKPVVTPLAGDAEVSLSWTQVPGAMFYDVYYDEDGGPIYSPLTIATEGAPPLRVTPTEFTLTGLRNGQSHYFAVVGSNGIFETPISDDVEATPAASPDPYEPDNDFANAKNIDLDERQTHSLHVGGDTDVMSFTISSEGLYRITSEGTGPSHLKMEIFDSAEDSAGSVLGSAETPFPSFEKNLTPGIYTLKVQSVSLVSIASYSITISEVL